MIECIIWPGKATDEKHKPLLISLKKEDKEWDIFQNLNKIRESDILFNKNKTSTWADKKSKKKNYKKKLKRQKRRKRMSSQGKGYIMCDVHNGTDSSKESPEEYFEREPQTAEDKRLKKYQDYIKEN